MRLCKQYPSEIKEKAILLRKNGLMYREIKVILSEWNIPKNTLSCWMIKAKVTLSNEQLKRNKAIHYENLK